MRSQAPDKATLGKEAREVPFGTIRTGDRLDYRSRVLLAVGPDGPWAR